MAEQIPDSAPQLVVKATDSRPGSTPKRWLVTWELWNASREALSIVQHWLPHGRFRAASQSLEPHLQLEPNVPQCIEVEVAWDEPAGTIVENGFLIFRVIWRDQLWRVLARQRIEADKNGRPRPRSEIVTSHLIGFSDDGEKAINQEPGA